MDNKKGKICFKIILAAIVMFNISIFLEWEYSYIVFCMSIILFIIGAVGFIFTNSLEELLELLQNLK